jgi:hypothetical protein
LFSVKYPITQREIRLALGKIYWDWEVPPSWNGEWSEEFYTIPEKTDYNRTADHMQMLEFITAMAWNSEYMHIEQLFIIDLRRVAPLIILSKPR